MLEQLEIKNYAIIEDLLLEFKPGLNIITGDTGAGKSILLGALNLLLGKRANTQVISQGKDKCITRAIFKNPPSSLKNIFDQHDLDYGDEIHIQREVNNKGKSRAFINDTPVTLTILQSISPLLIDIHQQFDQQHIAQTQHQFEIIDAYAQQLNLVSTYQSSYNSYLEDLVILRGLENKKNASIKEQDYISFQLNELENADILSGEEIRIEHELDLSNNLEAYINTFEEVGAHLSQEDSIISALRHASNTLNSLPGKTDAIDTYHKRIEELLVELQDIERESQLLSADIDTSGSTPEILTERLNTINQLINKHQVRSTEGLIELKNSYKNQLSSFESLDDEIKKVKNSLIEKDKTLAILAEKLHAKRISAAKSFDTKVKKVLGKMDMPLAKFITDLSVGETYTIFGKSKIEFLFTANAGTEPQTLRQVASGGELSRLNLSIKSLVADQLKLPTMIFDEIDTGISGKVALMMSQLLKSLASKHQLITITHSPQIASRGHHHLHVYKTSKQGKTQTKMKVLELKERIRNIAIMLSSDPPSSAAEKNAEELINIQ